MRFVNLPFQLRSFYTELERGDDAEEAVVNAIQKTGKTLLQGWVENLG